MTKLEEIALAIHRARYPDAPIMDGIEGLGPIVAAQALAEARAAVQALLEPTDGMLDAAAAVDPGYEDGNASGGNHWEAMICEVLAEK